MLLCRGILSYYVVIVVGAGSKTNRRPGLTVCHTGGFVCVREFLQGDRVCHRCITEDGMLLFCTAVGIIDSGIYMLLVFFDSGGWTCSSKGAFALL